MGSFPLYVKSNNPQLTFGFLLRGPNSIMYRGTCYFSAKCCHNVILATKQFYDNLKWNYFHMNMSKLNINLIVCINFHWVPPKVCLGRNTTLGIRKSKKCQLSRILLNLEIPYWCINRHTLIRNAFLALIPLNSLYGRYDRTIT